MPAISTMNAPDPDYMKRALALAESGLGRVAPNPSVGCVMVKDGVVMGEGQTQDGGRPHAEAVALEQAGERAKGATVYVTLEPCFKDNSSSCSSRLIEAGVAKIVIGCRDQNPEINGRGISALKQAGIEVVEGVMEKECTELNRGFFLSKNAGRPFVTLKIATSLDSKIAAASGESKWITGEEARASVHYTRARHDAILTGIGTILADDPQLTARVPNITHNARKIILDTTCRISEKAQIFAGCRANDVLIFSASSYAGKTVPDARVIASELDEDGKVSIPFVLKTLAEQGITRLMVEAGQGVFTSFLRSGLWDELHLYRAPILIGSNGRDAFGELGISGVGAARRLNLFSRETLGNDTLEIYGNS